MRPLKLLYLTDHQGSTVSLYRGLGPLSQLQKQGLITIYHSDIIRWDALYLADAVFVQRPMGHMKASLELCKSYGVPVWADYDDLLWEVPKAHPNFFDFNSLKDTLAIAHMADIVTVSTKEFLKDIPQATVVPNALDDRFLRFKADGPRKKAVSWRGSPTHEADLLSEDASIYKHITSNPDHTFYFLGSNSPGVLRYEAKNTVFFSAAEFATYLNLFAKYSPRAHLIPLATNRFNRAKSNIAWLEASLIGATCLVSEGMPEFSPEFCLPFDTPIREVGTKQAKLSMQYIEDCLLLSKVNEQRAEIIEKLWEMVRGK